MQMRVRLCRDGASLNGEVIVDGIWRDIYERPQPISIEEARELKRELDRALEQFDQESAQLEGC